MYLYITNNSIKRPYRIEWRIGLMPTFEIMVPIYLIEYYLACRCR